MGLAKAGQECFIELLNIYWGNVLNWGFCAGFPRLRQAFSVTASYQEDYQ